MTFSFFRTIRTHLLLLVLISVLPALGIMIYSGLKQSSHAILLLNLMFLCAAVIGIMFVAWFLGNSTIVKRLGVLVDASRKLGRGDLRARTGLAYKNDELGELAKTFDEMAASLERKHIEREEAEGHIKKAAEEWKTTFDSITDTVMILNNEFQDHEG